MAIMASSGVQILTPDKGWQPIAYPDIPNYDGKILTDAGWVSMRNARFKADDGNWWGTVALISSTPESLNFPKESVTKTVSVSTNYPEHLEIYKKPDWITATFNGTTLNVTPTANTGNWRSGQIQLRINSGSKPISFINLVQDAAISGLKVTPNSGTAEFNYVGSMEIGKLQFLPESNLNSPENPFIIQSDVNWINVLGPNLENGLYYGRYYPAPAPNQSTSTRTGTISVWTKNQPNEVVKYTLTQNGRANPNTNALPSTLSFASAGGTKSFIVTSAQPIDNYAIATAGVGWLTVNKIDNTNYNVVVQANGSSTPRSAQIAWTNPTYAENISNLVTVNQDGYVNDSVSANPTLLDFMWNDGMQQPVEITSSGPWTITIPSASRRWIFVDSISGNNGDVIGVSVAENFNYTPRMGSFVINCGTASQTVNVMQDGQNT